MKKKEINSKKNNDIKNIVKKEIKNKQESNISNKPEINKTKEVILSKEFRENRFNNSNTNTPDRTKYEDVVSSKNRNIQRSIFINEVKKEEKKENIIENEYIDKGYSSPKIITTNTKESINRILLKVKEQKLGVRKEIISQKNNEIKSEIKREVGVSQKPSNSNTSLIGSNRSKEVTLSKEFRENRFGNSSISNEIKTETKVKNIPIVQENISQKIVSSKIKEKVITNTSGVEKQKTGVKKELISQKNNEINNSIKKTIGIDKSSTIIGTNSMVVKSFRVKEGVNVNTLTKEAKNIGIKRAIISRQDNKFGAVVQGNKGFITNPNSRINNKENISPPIVKVDSNSKGLRGEVKIVGIKRAIVSKKNNNIKDKEYVPVIRSGRESIINSKVKENLNISLSKAEGRNVNIKTVLITRNNNINNLVTRKVGVKKLGYGSPKLRTNIMATENINKNNLKTDLTNESTPTKNSNLINRSGLIRTKILKSIQSEDDTRDVGITALSKTYINLRILKQNERLLKHFLSIRGFKKKSIQVKNTSIKIVKNTGREVIKSTDKTVDTGVNAIVEATEVYDTLKYVEDKFSLRKINNKRERIAKINNQKREVDTIRNIKTKQRYGSKESDLFTKEKRIQRKRKLEIFKNRNKKEKLASFNRKEKLKRAKDLFNDAKELIGMFKGKLALGGLLLIVILLPILSMAGGGGSSDMLINNVILTTDEQNIIYHDKYKEFKEEFDEIIAEEIRDGEENYDDLEVYGVDENGKPYDVNFIEIMAILAVKIEQDFKTNKAEFDYMKEIFEKMIFYEVEIEDWEEIVDYDEEGYPIYETFYRKIIIISYRSYWDIKDELGFDEEQLEWVERLMETADEVFDNLDLSGDLFYEPADKLTDEEIELYGGKFIHPTNGVGVETSPYGNRLHPIQNVIKFHNGLDIGGNNNTPIYAVKDGTITYAGVSGGYGNFIMIDHGNGMVTRYAHCSTIYVSVGQAIYAGDAIGRVGGTGNVTGPHLHFEVLINSSFVDPKNFL